ncbi:MULTISPECIES: pitrilysin family protein [unclassified Coleofasciculus]|uniref:M16 family metallopeptidase n=2 Tax=Cyanobacteriota TaxID=1117 RepID=UPI00168252EC|nr:MULTISPECIES: pitrilysin family protein [unclassified Coleofasciculus]MBD2086579.1 insulinase family protein [Coleofasciculus sp. FACHB-542]MBD2537679.1 insulinase family protein [Coleofasciculus sp. FACHB-SPT36]
MTQSVTRSLANPTIHRSVLDNGIVLITVENPAADIIAGRIFARVGGRWEPREKAGLSHLLSTVLTKGTDRLSSLEIAEQVESVGASLGADAAADYFLLSLKTVSADFPEMLQLAGELLRSPSFPEAEVELERRLALQDIRSQQEQPFTIAFDQLRQAMYQNHPYGFSSLGTEATVSGLSRADLQHYHQTYFRPDNLVISIAGRLTPQDATDLVNQVFGDWQSGTTPLPTLSLPQITPEPISCATPQDTQQSIVMLGYVAPSVQETDYACLKLLNTYLGNGLSSRLFVELREKRGLAYDVSAFYPTRLETSQFVVYMGTAPENTAIAYEGLRTEVERLCTTQLSDRELQAAKNKLLGQYALGKQTNAQLAQVFGWYEILGLGIEFDTEFQEKVTSVTPEFIQKVASRYFTEPYVSLVGPAEKLDIKN